MLKGSVPRMIRTVLLCAATLLMLAAGNANDTAVGIQVGAEPSADSVENPLKTGPGLNCYGSGEVADESHVGPSLVDPVDLVEWWWENRGAQRLDRDRMTGVFGEVLPDPEEVGVSHGAYFVGDERGHTQATLTLALFDSEWSIEVESVCHEPSPTPTADGE